MPALSTQGLDKSFGSLVVAKDINIAIPQGARYALIGPNGAGKTTLINLITGMLRPDAGRIQLGDQDITGLKPHQRVKRGLVRTFQINTLFPHLNALEAVTLAVCERRGAARNFWKQLPAYKEAVDEAYAILASLMPGGDCYRLTRELPYGQQRLIEIALALATRPRVLLLDEPAAGVPRDESAELFAAIAGLSHDITVLFIEHDMNLVFKFASRIIVMVAGEHSRRGYAAGKSRPTSACARSIWVGRAMGEALLALEHVRAGYGDAVVLDDISFEIPEHGSLAVLGRNGVGKSTLFLTIMGFTQVMRGKVAWRGAEITAVSPNRRARLGLGWVAQEREIFPSLTLEENLTVASRPGRWDLPSVYALFPRLAERRSNMGNQLSGGEQQMLAIARALMTNPALLLLDEPLEGLAPIIVEELAGRYPAHAGAGGHGRHPDRAACRAGPVAHQRGDHHGAGGDRASRARRPGCRPTRRRSTASSACRRVRVLGPEDLQQGFQCRRCEGAHVGLPVRASGPDRENALGWSGDGDAGMPGRVAVAVAGRARRSGLRQSPGRAVLLTYRARQQRSVGLAGRADAGHCRVRYRHQGAPGLARVHDCATEKVGRRAGYREQRCRDETAGGRFGNCNGFPTLLELLGDVLGLLDQFAHPVCSWKGTRLEWRIERWSSRIYQAPWGVTDVSIALLAAVRHSYVRCTTIARIAGTLG